MSITHTMNLLFFLVIYTLAIVGGAAVYYTRRMKRNIGSW